MWWKIPSRAKTTTTTKGYLEPLHLDDFIALRNPWEGFAQKRAFAQDTPPVKEQLMKLAGSHTVKITP